MPPLHSCLPCVFHSAFVFASCSTLPSQKPPPPLCPRGRGAAFTLPLCLVCPTLPSRRPLRPASVPPTGRCAARPTAPGWPGAGRRPARAQPQVLYHLLCPPHQCQTCDTHNTLTHTPCTHTALPPPHRHASSCAAAAADPPTGGAPRTACLGPGAAGTETAAAAATRRRRPGEPRLTAAFTPMENPCRSSCKLTEPLQAAGRVPRPKPGLAADGGRGGIAPQPLQVRGRRRSLQLCAALCGSPCGSCRCYRSMQQL